MVQQWAEMQMQMTNWSSWGANQTSQSGSGGGGGGGDAVHDIAIKLGARRKKAYFR